MNLRDVDVFNAIMITRGAGAAAALLDTSQPAISRSLAKLEAELGFKLFDRIRGRLVPTREGELFHAEVKANLVGLDRLRLRAAQIKEVGTGTIRVASLSALGHGLVPCAIVAFSRKHPQVRISYQVRTSNVVRDLVASVVSTLDSPPTRSIRAACCIAFSRRRAPSASCRRTIDWRGSP